MSISFHWDTFRQMPIVAILRGFDETQVRELVRAVVAGGITTVEVTMNTAGAADLVRMVRGLLDDRVNVGAGTVCDLETLQAALDAGAGFIVTPIVVPQVADECVARKIPIVLGAMTPTEVHQAWQAGASLVKVFPTDVLGPAHIRGLKGPLPQIPLMPTGGVTIESLPEFKKAGADAFGVGTTLFDRHRAAAGDWDWFTQQARLFCRAYRES